MKIWPANFLAPADCRTVGRNFGLGKLNTEFSVPLSFLASLYNEGEDGFIAYLHNTGRVDYYRI